MKRSATKCSLISPVKRLYRRHKGSRRLSARGGHQVSLGSGAVHVALSRHERHRGDKGEPPGRVSAETTATEREILNEIDMLAMEKKWAYLERKPEYAWLVNLARQGV